MRTAIKSVMAMLLGITTISCNVRASDISDIGKDSSKTIVIQGPIVNNVVGLADDLVKMSSEADTVDILINSPGGSVFAGFIFINAMEVVRARGTKIRCLVTSMAASMAFQILAHCTDRYALPKALLLWHPVRISGTLTLTPQLAQSITANLVRVETKLVNDLRKFLILDDATFYQHYLAETLFTAEEVAALDSNFVKITSDVPLLNSITNLNLDGGGSADDNMTIVRPLGTWDIFIYDINVR